MKILSIDTTSVAGSVALSEDDLLVAQEQQGASGTHSEKLLGSIDHLLNIARWRREELEGIAVAIGPGSFTGLRIGLATAKGLALAIGIPISAVSSLKSLALNGRHFPGTAAALIDARRGEIYAGAWRIEADSAMSEAMEECVLPPEELLKRLGDIDGELLCVGDGALAMADEIEGALRGKATIAAGSQVRPQAVNLATLALDSLRAGGEDVASMAPNYVRRSDAEIGFRGSR